MRLYSKKQESFSGDALTGPMLWLRRVEKVGERECGVRIDGLLVAKLKFFVDFKERAIKRTEEMRDQDCKDGEMVKKVKTKTVRVTKTGSFSAQTSPLT